MVDNEQVMDFKNVFECMRPLRQHPPPPLLGVYGSQSGWNFRSIY